MKKLTFVPLIGPDVLLQGDHVISTTSVIVQGISVQYFKGKLLQILDTNDLIAIAHNFLFRHDVGNW